MAPTDNHTPTENLHQPFWVCGLTLRTNNARAMQEIPAFWERVRSDFKSELLPGLAGDPHMYGVYCQYAGDHTDDYTLLAGMAVEEGTAAPEGMTVVEIPAGVYATFEAAGIPDVGATWGRILAAPLDRTYVADYERFSPMGQIEVFIGVKG